MQLPPAVSILAQFGRGLTRAGSVLPGLGVCGLVALVTVALARLEHSMSGAGWLEPLVLAILLGAVVRTVWSPTEKFRPGIDFTAKTLLEIAVVLLGASVSTAALSSLGPGLISGIFALVALAILIGYGIGRLLGLNPKMALLVACGNAICGNSAIAAVAPVIDADGEEVAASIALTAVLGVIAVLVLPVIGTLLSLSEVQFGTLAGLTVYAVPQVLAATAAAGALAIQTGTIVKLVRVLMLGPVILVLTLIFRARQDQGQRLQLHRLLPWFILGFLLMVGLRSLGLIPPEILPPLATAATVFTLLSMAALGLQTDVRSVVRASGRAAAAAVISLTALALLSLALITALGV